jgi:outer membrane protein assembly factor BamA
MILTMNRRRYLTPNAFWRSDESVRVSEFHVHGDPRTRRDVFDLYLQGAMRSRSANELHAALARAHTGLMGLGIFQSLRFVLDSSMDRDECIVAVIADEAPRGEVTVGGGAGGSGDEVLFSGTWTIRNLFGRAETAHVAYSRSPPYIGTGFVSVDTSLRKPLLEPDSDVRREVSLGAQWGSVHRPDSFHYEEKGGAFVSFMSG